jgi:hypothetical protein
MPAQHVEETILLQGKNTTFVRLDSRRTGMGERGELRCSGRVGAGRQVEIGFGTWGSGGNILGEEQAGARTPSVMVRKEATRGNGRVEWVFQGLAGSGIEPSEAPAGEPSVHREALGLLSNSKIHLHRNVLRELEVEVSEFFIYFLRGLQRGAPKWQTFFPNNATVTGHKLNSFILLLLAPWF